MICLTYNSSTVVHAIKYRQTFTGKDYQIKFLLEIKEYLKRITIFTKQEADISNKVKVYLNIKYLSKYKFSFENVGLFTH